MCFLPIRNINPAGKLGPRQIRAPWKKRYTGTERKLLLGVEIIVDSTEQVAFEDIAKWKGGVEGRGHPGQGENMKKDRSKSISGDCHAYIESCVADP